MRSEQHPHSVHDWLTQIKMEGVSRRPFAVDGSDLIDPAGYPDPLDTKPERAALAAILSVRAYQRARKSMTSVRDQFEVPALHDITYALFPPEEKVMILNNKNLQICSLFEKAMVDGILDDEAHLTSLSDNHLAASAYHRLASILEPHEQFIRRGYENSHLKAQLPHPSLPFLDVYGGVNALPLSMNNLYRLSVEKYYEEHGELPNIPMIIKMMRESYDTFTLPQASLHKASALKINDLEEAGLEVVELRDDRIELIPEVLQRVIHDDNGPQSRTTRCSFLTPTGDLQAFLDEQADFEDPMRDAFDLHMRILAG